MKRRMVSISQSTLLSVCLLAHFLDRSVSEDLHEIKTKPGDDVLLQCLGSRDADTVMLKWIRPDLKSEGFVFNLREKRVYENYQHPSFHGRVELRDPEMKDGDFSVILKNVNINDAGTYECYTGKKNTEGSELMNTINLKVEDLHEIKTNPGDDVLLQCRGSRDADTVMLKWIRPDLKSEGFVFFYRENRVYENYQYKSFRGRVKLKDPEMKDGDFSVNLKNVNINDTGTYECYTGKKNTGLELIKTTDLTVEDLQEIKNKAGDDVTLQGRGSRDADIVMLKWIRPDLKGGGYVFLFKDGKIDDDIQHESYRGRVELRDPEMKDGDFSVILKNVNINDTGTYECYVGNGGKSQLINSINLKVEPGDAAGHKGGGENKEKGSKDGGNTTLIVVVVLVLFLVVGIVGFLFYKKQRGPTDQSSYQQPPEQRIELQTVQTDSAAESSSPAPFKQQ